MGENKGNAVFEDNRIVPCAAAAKPSTESRDYRTYFSILQ